MAGRIVVFGATGYTGRLVVGELVRRGRRPLIAGRDQGKLDALAAASGGLETAVADAARPAGVRALVGGGDVLVTTVGPFGLYGRAALDAALDAGAQYVDAAGEPGFLREVFAQAGARARAAGCALLAGFGYDFVAGNLAGALAARDAGAAARRVDVGYFVTGAGGISSGSRATAAFMLEQRSHARRRGVLVVKPFAREVRTFRDRARRRPGVLFGGTEPLVLTRVAPQLGDVATYLGGFGATARGAQAASYLLPCVLRLPVVKARARASAHRLLERTGEGPGPAQRARDGTLVLAEARDAHGRLLARVRLEGGNAYDFSAGMLAYAAQRLAEWRPGADRLAAGALGPVDAFGLDELERACGEAGLRRA